MQKKWIASALAAILMLTPVAGFAEDYSLDEDYLDAIFGKIADLDEDEREDNAFKLKLNMGKNGFKALKRNWETMLSDDQKQELKDLGISDSDVEDNLDKLSHWSVDDRYALVDYAEAGKMSKLKKLNEKYEDYDDGSSSSSGGGGGSGGSGGSTVTSGASDDTAVVGTTTIEDEAVPEGVSEMIQGLKMKGLMSKTLEVKLPGKVDSYTDLQDHWAKEYAGFFIERGVISGRSEANFDPDATITKAEVLTLVAKVIVEDPGKMNLDIDSVSDVSQTDWYSAYVGQMISLGAIQTDENGMIHPDDLPERQEIVKILMDALNAMEIEGVESTPALLAGFDDASGIKPENFNAMQDAVALGFIKGMGDGRLAPTDKVTRGQIAVMLKHFHDYVISKIEEETA